MENRTELEYKEILVTPKMAEQWLETSNRLNRNISENVVKQYAADMKKGYWQFNGEVIQFGKDGKLKNGQHRLKAIVMAGVPVKMSVLYGVPDNVNIYDSQRKRNAANAVQFLGRDISKNDVAIARFLYECVINRNYVGNGQVVNFSYDEAESLKEARRIVSSNNNGVMAKAPCASAAYVMLKNGYDKELMKRFFRVGETGYYENGEESAVALRNMILNRKLVSNNRSERVKLFKATCKALTDFAQKKPRKVMYRDFEIENFDCFTGSNAELILRKYLN